MTTLIRKAKPSDAETILNAEIHYARTPGFLVSRPEELQPDAFVEKIQRLSFQSDGIYLVATQGDGIVGHAFVERMGMEALKHVVRLTIVVHPGFQKQGIGKLLMTKLIAWAQKESSVDKIELLVRATNAVAIRLYESYGFREEGRFKKQIKTPDGNYIDNVAMALFV